MTRKAKKQSETSLFGLDFPPTMYQRMAKTIRRDQREVDPTNERTLVRDLFDDPDDPNNDFML